MRRENGSDAASKKTIVRVYKDDEWSYHEFESAQDAEAFILELQDVGAHFEVYDQSSP